MEKKKKLIELEILDELATSGVFEIALVDSPAIESGWMAFRSEEFVKPLSGESEDEFIGRCMSVLIGDEGKPEDQAAAMCYSMWDQKFEAFQETYDDYPESAKENAQRALKYAEENGWGDCGTPIGKARANQLAKGEPISEDTIARMAAFERHRQNSDTPYGEGCGKLMWDAWGGDAGVEWAQRKLESIRRVELSIDTSGLPNYVDEITEDKDKKRTMEFQELDIFGYKTRYFYICPGAIATFKHIIEMGPDEETQGMVRSAALQADRVFEIEKDVLEEEKATLDQMSEATLLVDDFLDLMGEIDKELGMEHDVSYMIGHLEVIASYLPETDPEEFQERPISRIPKEERGREGSDKNKAGDTKTTRGGIEVSQEVEKTLKDKVKEHNEKNPQDSQKADLGMLKAVWRRGAGAYSVGTPGRRGMTRAQWAMGRVNAFLRILGGSAPSDKDYTQDNDLLPKSHPKHSEEKMADDLSLASVQSLRVGDAVSWNVGGQNPRGRIREIIREGGKQVPGTGFVLRGTKDDPGYIIEIYKQDTNNNWAPSGEYAGRKAASIMKNVSLSALEFSEVFDEDKILNMARVLGTTEQEYSQKGMNFSATDDNPNQDLYKFADGYTVYKYEGSISSNSRRFCREMVGMQKFYTYAEIASMGSAAFNPGFGEGGASTYSIWNWKGGANCKHRWQKYYVTPEGKYQNKGKATGKAGDRPYDTPNHGYVNKMSKMMFADEDQQIVVGPAMIPDIQIPRVDKKTKEVYYVKFAKETIARIAEKFMRENRNNDSNINHTDDHAGSYVMETWIVEHPEDKANTVYGLNVPVGTWVVKMRVADKKVWKMVKDGELTGFSIEGNFMSKEEYDKYNEEKAKYDNIVKLLNS
jgi:hypothetical protein